MPVCRVNELFHGLETELYPKGKFRECDSALQVLAGLQQNSDFIPFLNNLFELRLRFLLECVNDYDESALNAHTIMELKKVWHF